MNLNCCLINSNMEIGISCDILVELFNKIFILEIKIREKTKVLNEILSYRTSTNSHSVITIINSLNPNQRNKLYGKISRIYQECLQKEENT